MKAPRMSKLHVTLNSSGVGVRIHDLDLAAPLTAAATLEIQRLVHAYRLVVFERQVLEDRQLCEFAHRFGPPFIAPNGHPVLGSTEQIQEVVVVGNQASE